VTCELHLSTNAEMRKTFVDYVQNSQGTAPMQISHAPDCRVTRRFVRIGIFSLHNFTRNRFAAPNDTARNTPARNRPRISASTVMLPTAISWSKINSQSQACTGSMGVTSSKMALESMANRSDYG
ncbi:hypothetical protein MAR_004819, partial [Mya arenaria]